ncbi:hypothetical protein FIBSPDRAFT_735513 [Athelia psychrophila]|uniref:Transcription initiation factor TFIID subunit 8 n=1 Tax=Athelia psychrophila TaxID=1759441 RepID=A0A166N372_9AGAM|nr:hypothetical protein FIBSPDRAFT_735513 [Fibularhizoctonia sp. CBS 109695]
MSYDTYSAEGTLPPLPQTRYQPSQYPDQAQFQAPSQYARFPANAPHHLPPPPAPPSVTPQVAAQALQRVISSQLKDAGFYSAEPHALQKLELEVASLVEHLYERAHELANLSNRSGPIVTDILLASQDWQMDPKELRRVGVKSMAKRRKGATPLTTSLYPTNAPTLIPPPPRSPSPDMLNSDDEDTLPIVPSTLRALPNYFPALPAKHTYLRTPISPPKKAALPSLEKKLQTASLVQESLKNLLLATEDNLGHEDGELLGHIVNWEASTHPRKRWKVGV